ncbi:MAG: prepilin-type N-terminal cleavage/methylation domain-containing protein [Lachnospiraceae bacterium]|nr:prepilin-type N-terminal cleavage/methylation domain-containing protein [Lachnospiraceae bacterium]
MKKIKKDNKGFTLVELLIAITIISIVISPLFANFRSSTRLNGKAKAAMDVTNMGQNIMEGLSAYTPEEIILGFGSIKEDTVTNRTNNLMLMPNEVTVTSYGEASPSGTGFAKNTAFQPSTFDSSTAASAYASSLYCSPMSATGFKPYAEYLNVKDTPHSDHKYYFYAEGVKQARGTYDLLFEMDASQVTGYSGDADHDGKIGTGETEGYNDYEEAYITNINPMFDGVYTESAAQRANVAADFISMMTVTKNVTCEDFYPHMIRNCSIDVSKDPGTGYVTITLTERYTLSGSFTAASGDYVNESTDFSSATPTVTLTPTVVFDGATYKQAPREIYVYYMGNYSSAYALILDSFNIHNPDDVEFALHLMRISSSETNAANEASYVAQVDIYDDAKAMDIYSNLRDDLTKTAEQNATNRENWSRSILKWQGHTVANSSASHADELLEVYHESGGVRTEVINRIYAVKMYVYESGAAAANFPEDMRLTEFDGSTMQ